MKGFLHITIFHAIRSFNFNYYFYLEYLNQFCVYTVHFFYIPGISVTTYIVSINGDSICMQANFLPFFASNYINGIRFIVSRFMFIFYSSYLKFPSDLLVYFEWRNLFKVVLFINFLRIFINFILLTFFSFFSCYI